MKSLLELYKIGRGPSSSHTMGPERAARLFSAAYPDADSYKVTLYGSLALTGKGHGTDSVLQKTFVKPVTVAFDAKTETPHPNTMDIYAVKDGAEAGYWRVFSIGGGAIEVEGKNSYEPPEVYPHNTYAEIRAYCEENEITIPEYVERFEGPDIWDRLDNIREAMRKSIKEGLKAEGVLPGGLDTLRKAKTLYRQKHIDESPETRENRLVCSYAFAVSEENAAGEVIVTAPTCGSCGVVPAVLKYLKERHSFSDEEILKALATGGIIGNLIKHNASISGAECGCQAEIGSACSMAAAAAAQLYGMDFDQIEYSAEVAMEHHLGLTCDPIGGLVQIPCIERNAVAAMRALNAVSLANFLTLSHKLSFDMVVETMYRTGKDLRCEYRETSEGGLAATYRPLIKK
ncbi:MAG: L-serine ammonia-lyase, iron-sulfur-dependent, subunit alpha [Clostridia bacterium]|nr:L-serine ammonia-lyase, iron-sulfur-dependent, subunit alpha [Clostridia bacterium]